MAQSALNWSERHDLAMTSQSPNIRVKPDSHLTTLRRRAATCRACPLWKNGTQTVFGEGPSTARIVFVGEVPGDEEDLQGRPFVGPAGKLLRRVLDEIGIDAAKVYFTNVVKHFKWEPQGKRRLHKKPSPREIAACRPWLDGELNLLRPDVLVCLGATAAQTLLGRDFRVSLQRGKRIASPLARFVMATVHPSSILRAPTENDRRLAREQFARDLKNVAKAARAA